MTGDAARPVRRARRLVLWAGFFLLAAIVAGLSWLWTADLGFIEPRIERFLTDLSGREFEIRGGLAIDLGREVVAVARDVHWEDAEWHDADDMLSVGFVEARVDLLSLLFGPIVIEYVEIANADVQVARNGDGELNWDVFRSPASDGSDEAADEEGFGILLRQLDVDGLNVVYASPERDEPIRLALKELDQLHRDDDQLQVRLDGTLGDRPIRVDGEVGGWDAILSGRDIRFDLEGVFGSLEWTGDGYVDDVRAPRRPAFELTARGPSLDELARMLGLAEGRPGDIDIKAALVPADGGPLTLDVLARFGQTEVEARGAFSDLANLDPMDIDLLATGPNLGRVLRFFGIDQVQDAPFTVDVNARRDGSELRIEEARMQFGDSEFHLSARLPRFPAFDDAQVDLSIAGPDIEQFRFLTGLPGAATGAFSLDFDVAVRADGVEIAQLDVLTSLGHVVASGELAADTPGFVGSTFDLVVDVSSLAAISEAFDLLPLPAEQARAEGRIELEDGAIRVFGPAKLSAGGVEADVDGRVRYANGIAGTTARVSVKGPDLAALVANFATVDRVPAQPFDVGGRVQIDDGALGFSGVAGLVGRTAVSADGRLALAQGLAGSRLRFALEGPALEELVTGVGGLSLAPGGFALSGRAALDADKLAVEDLELQRDRGSLELDLELGLPVSRRWANFKASATGRDVRGLLAGVSGFEAREAPFTLKSSGSLRGGQLDIERFSATVGEASASAEGEVLIGDEPGRTRLAVSGRIPNLAALGTVGGRRFSEQGIAWDFDAAGRDGNVEVSALLVEMGDSDIKGTVAYTAGPIPELVASLSSEALFVAPLFEPDDEIDVEPVAERRDGRLIPDVALPLEALRKINAEIEIDIARLRRGALYLENVLLDATLRDGMLDVSDLSFDAASGSLASRLRLEPAEGGAETRIELKARNLALGVTEANKNLERTGDLDVNLRFKGDDLRAMAGSADGVVLVDMRGGAITGNAFLQALYGDVLQQILTVINPFYRPDTATKLSCLVAPILLDDGSLSSAPQLVVRTDKLNMVVRPSVDLKTERLDMSVRTMPRKGISISTAELFNPYVKIVGSLGKPALAVDEQGVLITGGAAVATGGLSILAKAAWDRLMRSGNPCDETRKEARELIADRLPDIELKTAAESDEGEKQ